MAYNQNRIKHDQNPEAGQRERGRKRRGRGGGRSRSPLPKPQDKPDSPRHTSKPPPRPPQHKHIPKRYGVVFYDTTQAALADLESIRQKSMEVDQLNVVIRADAIADMDHPDLLAIGKVKVFAGAAWTLIHERRVEEGWYDKPR